MKMFRIALAWLLFCCPAVAQVGQIPTYVQPTTAPPVGPPTFTYQSSNFGLPSGAGSAILTYTGPVSIGADTFITVPVWVQNQNGFTISSAIFTINGSTNIAATVTNMGTTAANGVEFLNFSATIGSGSTSISLTVTFSGSVFNLGAGPFYSAMASQLVSTTPTGVPVQSVTSGSSVSTAAFNAPGEVPS
jgi:hypothetical protein